VKISSLRHLSNGAVDHGLSQAAVDERASIVRVVVHIAEFDGRRLYRDKGFASMFRYCVRKLGYALIVQLEKRRCGRTDQPRPARPCTSVRHVPASVRRIVWERDGNQCAYGAEDGQRCSARSGLELDHVVPVARGGESTPSNLRLRCRAHNQLEAEHAFGSEFMHRREARAGQPAAQSFAPRSISLTNSAR
jgi:5-methylcytosine-specific restriction endonuclease McrA